MNENEITLEKQKVNRMVNRIYDLERENTKTGKLNEKEMKTEIEKIIEEEAIVESVTERDFLFVDRRQRLTPEQEKVLREL